MFFLPEAIVPPEYRQILENDDTDEEHFDLVGYELSYFCEIELILLGSRHHRCGRKRSSFSDVLLLTFLSFVYYNTNKIRVLN